MAPSNNTCMALEWGGQAGRLARIFHQGRGRCADAGAAGLGSPSDPKWLSGLHQENLCSMRQMVHQWGRPDEISGLVMQTARYALPHLVS